MSLVSINEVIDGFEGGALVGLVCLGWEEVRAFVEAAELENTPAILMVGPAARANMPLPIWGAMLAMVAKEAKVPLATHLDHGKSLEDVKIALEHGFSSVMYDGSALPLAQNIDNTAQMVEMAQFYGASTEGEVGFVGYDNGEKSQGTNLDEATQFAHETGVDLMAISVGNTHLQTEIAAQIDWERLDKIAAIGTALAIHGGSGIGSQDRQKMARDYRVRKFNIGTEVRQVFGASLRQSIKDNADSFDHLRLLSGVHEPLVSAARKLIRELKGK